MANNNSTITFSTSITGMAASASAGNLKYAMDAILRQSLQSIGHHLAERATQASPVRTGALRADMHAEPVQQVGNGFSVTVGTGVYYALTMDQHQEKTLAGPVLFHLGPGSQAADAAFSGGEGGVGGSALLRTANYWAGAYLFKLKKDIEDNLPAALDGQAITVNAIRI